MLKRVYMLCLAVFLAGCSGGSKTPVAHTGGTNYAEVTSDTAVDEANTPIVTDNPLPQYIDESMYEGDELGIVKTLNLMMKALKEQDTDAVNNLLVKDTEKSPDEYVNTTYYLSIDKLDFTEKPDDFTLTEDLKPVVVEYSEMYFTNKEIEVERQMFLFRLEDGAWKLHSIADWW